MELNRFYYFLCNEGSESFLKEEIALFHPELRFSFSTKGFLTFKLLERKLRNENFVFCRHFGEFVKKGNKDEISKLEELIPEKSIYVSYSLQGEIFKSANLEVGDLVYELIQIKENEFYLGKFLVQNVGQQYIGGRFNIPLPENAPSRAYLKILEGSQKLGVKFNSGENALEIGSSPGGATFALLNLGLNVIGVDPGIMDEECLKYPTFKHYKQSIQDFDPQEIDFKIDWLLVDMNLAPEATLNEIEKIFDKISPNFKGAFITLKMTKINLVSRITFYKKIIQRLGLNPKVMTQLPSHKQEFLLYIEN